MPNLVYYKDSSGVVRGPLQEDEATVLYKANFFRPDHVFKVIDAKKEDEFTSIDDLRTKFGVETPFGKLVENEEKELGRVYKELTTVLQERNELKKERDNLKKENSYFKNTRNRLIEEFKQTLKEPNAFSIQDPSTINDGPTYTGSRPQPAFRSVPAEKRLRITNNSPTSVRCLIDDSWNPEKAKVVRGKGYADFESNKSFIFIAPYLSDDPHDGNEFVCGISNNGSCSTFKFQ